MVCGSGRSRSHDSAAHRVVDEERPHAVLPGRSGLVGEVTVGPSLRLSPAPSTGSMGLAMQSVHALAGVDLIVGEALADGWARDAEPDGDHRRDAVGEAEDQAVRKDRAGLAADLAPEAADPAVREAARSKSGTGDHNGPPAGSMSVEVKTAATTGWMSASRTRGGPDDVDVGQVREHDGIEMDRYHTPSQVEGVGLGRQTRDPRRVWSPSGLVPGGAFLPGHAARGVRLPLTALDVVAERGACPIAHAPVQSASAPTRQAQCHVAT